MLLDAGANVLLATTGAVKLTDFGCSKILRCETDGAPASTPTNRVGSRLSGTVPFMAPEGVFSLALALRWLWC